MLPILCTEHCFQVFFYIDSPPNKSLGRYEFKFDGVPLGSLQSRVADHGLTEFVGQFVFHVSVEVGLLEPLQLPEEAFC